MQKIILTIFILLIAVATIVMFVYPSFEKLKMTQANIEQKQQEANELANYIGQLQEIVYQLRGSQDQLAKIDQSLLQSVYLPSVFQLAQSASLSSGVKMEGIQLGKQLPVKDSKNILKQEVNFKFLGDYQAFKSLIKLLESNSRLILINNIRFSKQDSAGKSLPPIVLGIEVFSYSN